MKHFMSDESKVQVESKILRLENIVQNQSNVDDLWISVKNLLLNELDTIPDLPKSNQKKQNKQFRKSQPFWNRNLETAWRDVCRSENNYLMYKANSRCEIAQKNQLRAAF